MNVYRKKTTKKHDIFFRILRYKIPTYHFLQAARERRPFLRRTRPSVETTTESLDVETTTNKFTRRGNNKFKNRKTEKDASEKDRPSLEKPTRNEKPQRSFVRRRPGGATSTTSVSTTSTTIAPSRRPFRVASRRRPFTPSTTSTTTTTTQATTQVLESEESLQEIDTDAYEEPSQAPGGSGNASVQYRRPLQLPREDQRPAASSDDARERHSKKYSASFRNQISDVTEGTLADDYNSETAVALAAHQLLAAPVPIVPEYDEPKTTRRPKTTQTIVDYKYTSPYYTEEYKTQDFTEEYFRTAQTPTRQGLVETSTPYYQSDVTSTYFTDSTRVPSTESSTRSRTTYTATADFTDTGIYTSTPEAFNTRTTYANAPETFTRSRTYATPPRPSGVSITVGSEGSGESTAKFTYDTFPSTTFSDFETRVSRPRLSTTINPTVSDLNVPTARFTTSGASSYPSTVPNKFPRPAGFSPNLVSLGFESEGQSTLRLESNPGPSTARYFGSSDKVPVEVSTDNGPSQEPSYFTREYLLESPVTKAYDDEYQYLSPITTPRTTTRKPPRRKTVYRRISTTPRPTSALVPETIKPRQTTRKPFEKIPVTEKDTKQTVKNVKESSNGIKPLSEYDYYDDSQEKMGVKYEKENKVFIDSKGNIECLDIGNFAHPTSCKKFISCARIRGGSVLGWEYICPKGLSFDPVGGICNWSAGLGCQEKDI
ncbi:mucin-5AC-like [Zerene cesonia]|uniref:mucin-5AC-like n=1 Tax=Zerene cesonia TaxID=33412 RepID=UPI0018E5496C|nr:mucin-5AC-like [Zerene cesonia]